MVESFREVKDNLTKIENQYTKAKVKREKVLSCLEKIKEPMAILDNYLKFEDEIENWFGN